jgi:two-component system, response regulator YesN
MDISTRTVAVQHSAQVSVSIKVLIADDESLARTTLRSMLQELQQPLEILEDATNGEEMVELVRRYTPDIIFVDIKMPKLDGLEAIKHSKALAPDAKWLILTGFSEFVYAQEALRIGVSDYLLKPVDPGEVGKVVAGVIEARKRRLLQVNEQFERDLAALYHGLISLSQEDPDSLLLRAHFLGVVFYIDGSLTEAENAQRQSDFLRNLQGEINQLLADTMRIALFSLPSGEIALIGAWRTEREAPGEQMCRRCFQAAERILPRYCDDRFCVTMLQSVPCRSYEELYEALSWLQEFAALRSMYGIGRKISMRELAAYAAQPHLVAVSLAADKLIRSFREKAYVHYMQALDEFVHIVFDECEIDAGMKKGVARFLGHSLPCQIASQQGRDAWKRTLYTCGDQWLLAQQKRDHRDMVAQVIAFIEQNYHTDIGITQIADRLQVTPNYLSALFHKKMGITFVRYLTKIRLLKAKELLADPEMRVQQVAELVGYTSARHFAKLFTSFFGYYPSEQHKKAGSLSSPSR